MRQQIRWVLVSISDQNKGSSSNYTLKLQPPNTFCKAVSRPWVKQCNLYVYMLFLAMSSCVEMTYPEEGSLWTVFLIEDRARGRKVPSQSLQLLSDPFCPFLPAVPRLNGVGGEFKITNLHKCFIMVPISRKCFLFTLDGCIYALKRSLRPVAGSINE